MSEATRQMIPGRNEILARLKELATERRLLQRLLAVSLSAETMTQRKLTEQEQRPVRPRQA